MIMLVAIASGAHAANDEPWTPHRAAGRIESGDYSAQVPERGSPELRSVARAFNSMSSRLQGSDEQRRTFCRRHARAANSPFGDQSQAEAFADGMYPATPLTCPHLDATAGADRLVDDLRTLVLTDARQPGIEQRADGPRALLAPKLWTRSSPQAESAQQHRARVHLDATLRRGPSVSTRPASEAVIATCFRTRSPYL